MKADKQEWDLWGRHPSHCDAKWIKLFTGSLRNCNSKLKVRRKEELWELVVYKAGGDPPK